MVLDEYRVPYYNYLEICPMRPDYNQTTKDWKIEIAGKILDNKDRTTRTKLRNEKIRKELLKDPDKWYFIFTSKSTIDSLGVIIWAYYAGEKYGITGQNAIIRKRRRQEVDGKISGYIMDRWPSVSHVFKGARKAIFGGINENDEPDIEPDVHRYTGSETGIHPERRIIYSFKRLGNIRYAALVELPGSEDVQSRSIDGNGFIQQNLAKFPVLLRGYGKRFGQVRKSNSNVRLQSFQPPNARSFELVHMETIRLDSE